MAVPLLYESHSHTLLCKHAVGTTDEYAAVAEARGLKGIHFTCHCPLPEGRSARLRMAPEEYEPYLELIRLTAERWQGRVEVRPGLESDFVPGLESWLEKLHGRFPLHHVLGSIHPQMDGWLERHYDTDWDHIFRAYFQELALAAESGLFDTLSHPDLIKNEAPELWNVERLLPDIQKALDRIAATGVAMELNTSGLNKRLPELNPGVRILQEMRRRNIPVVLGADAHNPQRVGDHFPEALRLLQDLGFSSVSYFLARKRQEVQIAEALVSLRPLSGR